MSVRVPKDASDANLKKHYHKINKSAGDFSSAISQMSDDSIATHSEVIIKKKVHAPGAGCMLAADLVKGQECQFCGVRFCQKGCNGEEIVCHIYVI
jgi:hypothetical protein